MMVTKRLPATGVEQREMEGVLALNRVQNIASGFFSV